MLVHRNETHSCMLIFVVALGFLYICILNFQLLNKEQLSKRQIQEQGKVRIFDLIPYPQPFHAIGLK